MKRVLFFLVPLFCHSPNAAAAPPDACSFFTVAEINQLAKGGDAERSEKHGQRSEAQCNWLRTGGDNVMNLTIRQSATADADVKLAAKMQTSMYKKPVKDLPGLGDQAFWCENLGMLTLRKGEYVVSLSFGGSRYGGEAETVAVAKQVVAKLK